MTIAPEKLRSVEIVDQISNLFDQLKTTIQTEKPIKSRVIYGCVENEIYMSRFHAKRLRYWIVEEKDLGGQK